MTRLPRIRMTAALTAIAVSAIGGAIAPAIAGAWVNTQKLVKIASVCAPDGSGRTDVTAAYTNKESQPVVVSAMIDGTQPTTATTLRPGETYSPTFLLNNNYPGGTITFHLAWAKKSGTDDLTVAVPASSLSCAQPTNTVTPGPTTTVIQTVIKYRTKIVVRHRTRVVVRYKIRVVQKPTHAAFTP